MAMEVRSEVSQPALMAYVDELEATIRQQDEELRKLRILAAWRALAG